jgi:ATP-dependent Clp protease adaptor protein ClpS
MAASAPTKPADQRLTDPVDAVDSPWVTIVWDDPVNLMNYVTYVFQTLFGYSEPHATKLMLQVHNEGKAVVASGSREEMERHVEAMHAYGLWASLEHQ